MSGLYFTPTINITETTRRVQYEGRDTIIAPVILMVEGVHNGSSGPLFYSADELAACAHLWNGMPIPVLHPTDQNGLPISCNSPDVVEKHNVGRLYNVTYEASPVPRLRGELYIDVKKVEKVNAQVLDILMQGKALDVSTGLFSSDEIKPGTWNGEEYKAIVRNIKPDHLALLPGQKGACSWADGCGVRVNKKGEIMTGWEKLIGWLKGESVKANIFTDEKEADEVLANIAKREDVNPEHGVMEYGKVSFADMKNHKYPIDTEEHIRAAWNYINQEKNAAKYSPEDVKVMKLKMIEAWKRVIDKNGPLSAKTNGEEQGMAITEERKVKVSALIANGAFVEEDRKFLEECDCPQFSRLETLAARPVKAEEKIVEKKVLMTMEEMIASNPEFKANHDFVQGKIKEHREELIKQVKANAHNKFTDEMLTAMDIAMLETVASSIAPVANYEGNLGGARFVDNKEEAPLELPKLEIK